MCGGGTRGGVLPEIMASVHRAPVFVNTVEEATSLGAAIIAAVGVGLYSTIEDAVAAMGPELKRVDADRTIERSTRAFSNDGSIHFRLWVVCDGESHSLA